MMWSAVTIILQRVSLLSYVSTDAYAVLSFQIGLRSLTITLVEYMGFSYCAPSAPVGVGADRTYFAEG